MEIPVTTRSNREVKKRNFPNVLYTMLQKIEMEGRFDIAAWSPHGRTFQIHKVHEFEEQVLPRFFRHRNFVSFQRQLNIYCFRRITFGQDQNSYYHEYFIRGRPDLISQIQRVATKGSVDRRTDYSLDLPNFHHDNLNSSITQQSTTNIPSTGIPSGLTSSAASLNALSSEEQNEALQQLLLQIQARNLAIQSPSFVVPTQGFQNTYTTLLNTGPALLITQQQIELLRNYLQLTQTSFLAENETRIQETLASIQSLSSSAPSVEMQQQIATSNLLVDGRSSDNNFLNQPYRLDPYVIYGNNLSAEDISRLLLPTAPTGGMQQQSSTALPIAESRSIENIAVAETYQQSSPAHSGNNFRDYNLQFLLSTALSRCVQQERATAFSIGESRSAGNQSHHPAIYGTNVGSENIMIQLLGNSQTPAATFPSRLLPNNELNQHYSLTSNHLEASREDIHSLTMLPDSANPNLTSGIVESPERSEGRKNEHSGQLPVVPPRK